MKSIVGESPFFNKKKSLSLSVEKLDLLLSANIDINCTSTSRLINGYSVGSESVFENLSYNLDVNPKTIFDLIKCNVANLHLTKAKYLNDLMHKIILKELGFEQISNFKLKEMSVVSLVAKIKSSYSYIDVKPEELSKRIISILQIHHKNSFFNKPLVLISNNFLTVGQVYNG